MKIALFAAAAAIAVSTGATVVSTAPAFADTVNTSPYRPFGTKIHRTDRVKERIAERQAEREYLRQTYVAPAPRPYVAPEVRAASANLAAVRDQVYADGRVTLFEKIKLKAAENRYHRTVATHR